MVQQIKVFSATVMASALTIAASAQVTTSAISGKIIDEMNEPVIGATVTAVHEPSGTLYGAVTNIDGRYTIQGMRTGGPYKVEITYVGYQKATYTGIYLELGNTFSLNGDMKPASELLDEVVVVADARPNGGASKNFSTSSIENTPTVDRNVYDIVKNMPMAMTSKNGGITFAGSNNRYNSFQIDGTVSNDVFGLAASGTNGGQTGANPISMDAIQEIQVVVAPFDVRQSGFTGGGINAITKQGTNTTHGSAYTYFNNQNWQVQCHPRLREISDGTAIHTHVRRNTGRSHHQGQAVLLRECRRKEGILPFKHLSGIYKQLPHCQRRTENCTEIPGADRIQRRIRATER